MPSCLSDGFLRLLTRCSEKQENRVLFRICKLNKGDKPMKKKQTILIGVVILLLIVLLGVGIWIGISLNKQPDNPNPNQGGVQLDPNQGGYVDPNQGSDTPSQVVAIPGWGKIVIPTNTTEVTVDFFNPEQNKDLYYLYTVRCI